MRMSQVLLTRIIVHNEFTNKGRYVYPSDWKILTPLCQRPHPYAYVREELPGQTLLTHSPAKRTFYTG